MENKDSIPHETYEIAPGECSHFSAPAGTLERGRLVFTSGAQGFELTADSSMPYLYQAHFRGPTPRVWRQENIVTVDYMPQILDRLVNLRRKLAAIRLNGEISWEIEFHKGVSQLSANLAQLQLRSLDILGDAHQVRLALSRPKGSAFIYVAGGVNQTSLRVASTAEVRVHIGGGSTNLEFADRRYAALGSETSLESPGFESATNRYDICIAGGASNLTITRAA